MRGVLSPVVSSPGLKRTIRVHPVPRLRISADLPVIQARPCLEYRGTSFHLRLATVFEVCSFCLVFVCNLAAEVRVVCKGTNERIKGNVMSTNSVSVTTVDLDVMCCMRFTGRSYGSSVSCQFDAVLLIGAWDVKVAVSQNDSPCSILVC